MGRSPTACAGEGSAGVWGGVAAGARVAGAVGVGAAETGAGAGSVDDGADAGAGAASGVGAGDGAAGAGTVLVSDGGAPSASGMVSVHPGRISDGSVKVAPFGSARPRLWSQARGQFRPL